MRKRERGEEREGEKATMCLEGRMKCVKKTKEVE